MFPSSHATVASGSGDNSFGKRLTTISNLLSSHDVTAPVLLNGLIGDLNTLEREMKEEQESTPFQPCTNVRSIQWLTYFFGVVFFGLSGFLIYSGLKAQNDGGSGDSSFFVGAAICLGAGVASTLGGCCLSRQPHRDPLSHLSAFASPELRNKILNAFPEFKDSDPNVESVLRRVDKFKKIANNPQELNRTSMRNGEEKTESPRSISIQIEPPASDSSVTDPSAGSSFFGTSTPTQRVLQTTSAQTNRSQPPTNGPVQSYACGPMKY